MSRKNFWMVLYYTFFTIFLGTAALNMLHLRGGFLTNYVADLVVPAWLYVVSRGLHPVRSRKGFLQKTFGRTPEIAAVSLFVASTLTEVSQRYWPHGVFSGRFDVLDVVAYAVGLAACYGAERILSDDPSASVHVDRELSSRDHR